MKIVIPGGSGQVGTVLARHFAGAGHEVVVLSRTPPAKETVLPWRVVQWDGKTLSDWASEIDGAYAVINLAGRSVNCRYTPENRAAITNSRVDSTRVVGEAIARADVPPLVWLQAATATIYAHRLDAPNDEATGIIGGESEPFDTWRFSVGVAQAWEDTFTEAETPPQTRKVALRSAIVMNADRGSAFDVFLSLVRFGVGGTQGNGRQMVSWIHEQDFARALEFLIQQNDLRGPINVCAPNAVPNREFMRELRRAAGVPFGIPAPAPLLELGAIFLKTETELVLKSRWVTPDILLRAGFTFDFPEWHSAAHDLCALSRERKTAR